MQEAGYDVTDVAFNNSNRFRGDEHLLVKFFTHPKQDAEKSLAEGRPIYRETTYIQIMSPGNKDSIVIRPATAEDKARFPEHFRRFTARESQEHVEGTLLEDWAGISRSQVEELKFLNVKTVEQLANLNDASAQNVMGVAGLKQRAQKFIEGEDSKALKEAQEMIAKLNARLEALEGTDEEEDEDGDD